MNSLRKTTSTNYQNQTFLEDKCALNELIHLLSKRWITEVLFSIEEGNNRFSSLKKSLEQISDNILADRLRLLENHNLIHRCDIEAEKTLKVEYALTDAGTKLSELLDGLCKFTEAHTESFKLLNHVSLHA